MEQQTNDFVNSFKPQNIWEQSKGKNIKIYNNINKDSHYEFAKNTLNNLNIDDNRNLYVDKPDSRFAQNTNQYLNNDYSQIPGQINSTTVYNGNSNTTYNISQMKPSYLQYGSDSKYTNNILYNDAKKYHTAPYNYTKTHENSNIIQCTTQNKNISHIEFNQYNSGNIMQNVESQLVYHFPSVNNGLDSNNINHHSNQYSKNYTASFDTSHTTEYNNITNNPINRSSNTIIDNKLVEQPLNSVINNDNNNCLKYNVNLSMKNYQVAMESNRNGMQTFHNANNNTANAQYNSHQTLVNMNNNICTNSNNTVNTHHAVMKQTQFTDTNMTNYQNCINFNNNTHNISSLANNQNIIKQNVIAQQYNDSVSNRPVKNNFLKKYNSNGLGEGSSDSDDDYYPSARHKSSVKKKQQLLELRKRNPGKKKYSTDEDSSVSEFDKQKQKKDNCTILENIGEPSELIVDRVIGHVDYLYDPQTGIYHKADDYEKNLEPDVIDLNLSKNATNNYLNDGKLEISESINASTTDRYSEECAAMAYCATPCYDIKEVYNKYDDNKYESSINIGRIENGLVVTENGSTCGDSTTIKTQSNSQNNNEICSNPTSEFSNIIICDNMETVKNSNIDHAKLINDKEVIRTSIECTTTKLDNNNKIKTIEEHIIHAPTEHVKTNNCMTDKEESNTVSNVQNDSNYALEGIEYESLIKVRKYLIKWVDVCHLKNEYLTLEEIKEKCSKGLKKVQNYIKKQEEYEQSKDFLGDDEREQANIALELQRQLDADALIPERIITNETVEKENGLKITYYFVKWQSTSYDQATWESYDFLVKNNYKHLIDEYNLRESRIYGPLSAHSTLNQHDLSETSFTPYTQTPAFLGSKDDPVELRDYQLTGLNWIVSRMKKNLSVLLADEMGLGKTAQTIAVIGHLLYAEKLAGPFLLIVPQSTIDNWLSEFKKWLPLANVVLYHGVPEARKIVKREELKVVKAGPMSRVAFESFVHPRSRLSDLTPQQLRAIITNRLRYRCDVVITTPSIFQWTEDLQELRSISWYIICVDEAHQLKNRESKRFKELCDFRSRYKLLLSGTPLHNNLDELWSLLHFMNPTIYQSLAQFKARYSEIENTTSTGEIKQQQLSELQQALSAIVLRRVKRDVLKTLPSKVEHILRVELSPIQEKLCQDVILRNYDSLSRTTGGSKVTLQNICVELKKICNHPFLLKYHKRNTTDAFTIGDYDCYYTNKEQYNHDIVWSSGKMCLIHKLLDRLKAKGHRVLIFSQMVRMLDILSKYLTIYGYKFQRLDGTMSRDVRKKAMDRFNAVNSEDFCFLLSTKAGGLGINLTSADTVIIYDSDWNPQNDLQAEARAHRIGQTKVVQIYRIVTKNTIEEDILERAKSKMVLDALVVQGLNSDSNIISNASKQIGFSREELTKILKFGATKLWDKNECAQTSAAECHEIDLDKVLAEAEEQNTDSTRTADLLNSYSNISDFSYEAPKNQEGDKISWDKVVPLEERMKYNEETAPSVPKQRSKRLTLRIVPSDDDTNEIMSDNQVIETRSARKRKSARGNLDMLDTDDVTVSRKGKKNIKRSGVTKVTKKAKKTQ